jgi:hypothetical protein
VVVADAVAQIIEQAGEKKSFKEIMDNLDGLPNSKLWLAKPRVDAASALTPRHPTGVHPAFGLLADCVPSAWIPGHLRNRSVDQAAPPFGTTAVSSFYTSSEQFT